MLPRKKKQTVQDLLDGALFGREGIGHRRSIRKTSHGVAGSESVSQYSQSEVKHIDHYLDGIPAPRRERKPFDPVKYMRGAAA